MSPASPTSGPTANPRRILKALAALRTATGAYPAGHPMVADKLSELHDAVQQHLHLGDSRRVEIDVIHGVVHLNGVSYGSEGETQVLGVDSIHIAEGVTADELRTLAEVLWRLKADADGEPIGIQLARRQVRSISVGRLVPLDTGWQAEQWPDRPETAVDPDYEESIALAELTFERLSEGRSLDLITVRDLVQLLMCRVATSNAALAQILSVKQYENLTYCHSVNVAVLSLLLGRQLRLDDDGLTALVEAALLHDVGKTRVPIDLVKKPGALDKHERRMMEAHTTLGAEILVQVDGLRPLTPLVALEHHRSVNGSGYPDLGDSVPHVFSQIVSVADIYEAVTGARSYQAPAPPERACLLLARLAGEKLNAAMVKALINAITFFPVGSIVRTTLDEVGIVMRTNPHDPLHPVLQLVDESLETALSDVDTSARDASGTYRRHIRETLAPRNGTVRAARLISRQSSVVSPQSQSPVLSRSRQ
jgi:putative nucleotidyltransferase with HDIG domain